MESTVLVNKDVSSGKFAYNFVAYTRAIIAFEVDFVIKTFSSRWINGSSSFLLAMTTPACHYLYDNFFALIKNNQ